MSRKRADGITITRNDEEHVRVNVDGRVVTGMMIPRGTQPDVRVSDNGGWLIVRERGRERAVLLHERFPVGGPYPPHPWREED